MNISVSHRPTGLFVIEIRVEQQEDIEAARLLNHKAFGRPHEGCIVDALRETCKAILSLVVISNNKIVGHVLFSPVTVEKQGGVIKGMA